MVLKVSRSIGDAYLKKAEFNREPLPSQYRLAETFFKPILSCEPSISVHKHHPDDQFLIFASDGIWEHIGNQEAVHIITNNPPNFTIVNVSMHLCQPCCVGLWTRVFRRRGRRQLVATVTVSCDGVLMLVTTLEFHVVCECEVAKYRRVDRAKFGVEVAGKSERNERIATKPSRLLLDQMRTQRKEPCTAELTLGHQNWCLGVNLKSLITESGFPRLGVGSGAWACVWWLFLNLGSSHAWALKLGTWVLESGAEQRAWTHARRCARAWRLDAELRAGMVHA
ncbi:hypothetical protein PIB30_029932 [Stylosanthes scabra]|uniref:PPM-type phosphatase domain-containing protein n=1 Tax=Stylosanthes scabra TaxID=79078 RepID=A0ABU6UCG6_9FABA|nr:hypothetical protein [Stylosanthes scabra]